MALWGCEVGIYWMIGLQSSSWSAWLKGNGDPATQAVGFCHVQIGVVHSQGKIKPWVSNG